MLVFFVNREVFDRDLDLSILRAANWTDRGTNWPRLSKPVQGSPVCFCPGIMDWSFLNKNLGVDFLD